ncbi:NAD(P)-dependent alcohol dehydrogenase [Agrobacterium sp. SHOUNA12C]|uniref:Zinc-containing alcohol dehydrogenase n=1 Tax=Rhizobium rhizogenes NBRC 13257 TaxID=1220581 RepID=A0AA87U4E8_RHIRH|nr:NAD(P)-dependent alcohol dehydrogenase [Rhizobium rhizogenes]MCJ9720670.1 NAD(P)-dependent alcohol dehydrogenase [Agrobacterium sp. BETTINA12B]MCJ9757268.1 NAD(P)-dependent alcohol dehydrogenase [Agrobacterium sp. SHOUNA12C]NTF51336.1 NAD(P)-dependent alcohol dehydrogenase [Rhizobium rhizogenes]NTF57871.1 NAD(P)-dependent alcohol dehydrogenase [Rhizobium rhizogenes]NTF64289.1 NAD(P)-dependent alcohol dehydrogenase [Rhizobium rhizogenes]
MKQIQYDQYGGPEVMKFADFELRVLGNQEVAVKVNFAAINPIDWKVRNGYLKMVTGKKFPRAMGSDFSGTVISVGPGVTRFKRGDAVFGSAHIKDGGALGEAVIAPETFLAHKPEAISFEEAACLGTPGVTAWNGIVDKAKVMAGNCVFINGCTGAVGEAAVQLALMLGATVAGSCSAAAMSRARELGVEPLFDYRTTDLSKIRDRFDVVYDTAGTMKVATGLGLLRQGGVFLDIDPTPGKFIRAIFNRKLKPIVCSARADILDGLAQAAAKRKLQLPIGEIVPLIDAIRVLTALEGGYKVTGKVLVRMD